MLSALQKSAVDAWIEGKNVRIVAVPGAGKSRVLLEAVQALRARSLILAYNRELCLETKARLIDMGLDEVVCMTFHGLATYCVRPTYDDIALADLIDDLDAGEVVECRPLVGIECVLIDEVQDFRPSFKRLIQHLVLVNDDVRYMVVGDSMQMLYDYSDDDPASLEFIEHPELHFPSTRDWSTIELDETHRLPPSVVAVVNGIFDTRMRAVKRDGPPVEIYTIKMWQAGAVLQRLLADEPATEVCILTPRKKNNGPLRAAVNYMSQRGVRFFIIGVDGQDVRIKANKTTISTWHASKGTEHRVCVVFGFGSEIQTNPAYVALTRSHSRLIILQDDQTPNARLLATVKRLQAESPGSVVVDRRTADLAANATAESAEVTLVQRARAFPPSPIVALDEWRPCGSGRWMREMMVVEGGALEEETDDDVDTVILLSDNQHADVREVYRLVCIMQAETIARNGLIRRVDDMLSPIRVARDMHYESIVEENHSRFVSPTMSEEHMLPPMYKKNASDVYAKASASSPEMIPLNDWCALACITRAWNSYHHELRQLQPFSWLDDAVVRKGVDHIARVCPLTSQTRFDVRLHRVVANDRLAHIRVDACDNERAYLFCFGVPSHAVRMSAAIAASMHPKRACAVANLKTGVCHTIHVAEPDALLARVVAP